jgi:hypothetical protein
VTVTTSARGRAVSIFGTVYSLLASVAPYVPSSKTYLRERPSEVKGWFRAKRVIFAGVTISMPVFSRGFGVFSV